MRRRKKKTKRGREKFKEIRRKVENHEEIDDEDLRFVIRMSKRRKKRKEEDTLVTNKKPPDLEKGKSRNQVRKTPPDKPSRKGMKRFAGRMYEIIIRMKKSNKKGIKLCD
jgi:hypothetical protein